MKESMSNRPGSLSAGNYTVMVEKIYLKQGLKHEFLVTEFLITKSDSALDTKAAGKRCSYGAGGDSLQQYSDQLRGVSTNSTCLSDVFEIASPAQPARGRLIDVVVRPVTLTRGGTYMQHDWKHVPMTPEAIASNRTHLDACDRMTAIYVDTNALMAAARACGISTDTKKVAALTARTEEDAKREATRRIQAERGPFAEARKQAMFAVCAFLVERKLLVPDLKALNAWSQWLCDYEAARGASKAPKADILVNMQEDIIESLRTQKCGTAFTDVYDVAVKAYERSRSR